MSAGFAISRKLNEKIKKINDRFEVMKRQAETEEEIKNLEAIRDGEILTAGKIAEYEREMASTNDF